MFVLVVIRNPPSHEVGYKRIDVTNIPPIPLILLKSFQLPPNHIFFHCWTRSFLVSHFLGVHPAAIPAPCPFGFLFRALFLVFALISVVFLQKLEETY